MKPTRVPASAGCVIPTPEYGRAREKDFPNAGGDYPPSPWPWKRQTVYICDPCVAARDEWIKGNRELSKVQGSAEATSASPDQMRFTAGTGDAGQFIVLQAVARGGQLLTTDGLPSITGAWRYSEDAFGVVIRMPRENYEAVENLLLHAFGKPKFGPTETTDGGKLGGYRLTEQGGAIQFGYDAEGTQIIIIRQLTQQEFADGLTRATKELGKDQAR